jgi:hypothetical protein
VRGVVYETPPGLPRGRAIARHAAETWQIPVEVLDPDPVDHGAALAAVRRLLAP